MVDKIQALKFKEEKRYTFFGFFIKKILIIYKNTILKTVLPSQFWTT